MEPWIFWLSLFLILGIIEIATQWLTTFCLAIGSIGALIASIANLGLAIQLLTLGIVTILAFVIAAPKFKRYYERKGRIASMQSNMEALKGRIVTVTVPIESNKPGRVKVDGDSWLARSVDNTPRNSGDSVEVIDFDSIVIIVK